MTDFYVMQIKELVKMGDLLNYYGFEIGKGNRIACPFHNGEDKNLGFKDNFYNCFVCGSNGDVIKFVQDYFNLTFSEALHKINEDFSLNLPIGEKLDKRKRVDMARKVYESKKKRETAENERTAVYTAFWNALDEFIRLDNQKRLYKPEEGIFELHPLFVEAIKNLPLAEFRLECAKGDVIQWEMN